MKTILEDLIQADWAPSMEASARALAMVVAIPAAIVLVLAQWLLFTWRRPLAGVLALVPVRRSDAGSHQSDPVGHAVTGVRAVECWTDRATGEACFKDVAPPATEISPALDAALSQSIGLTRPARPVELDGLVLAPRRQRRGSKRPQVPA